MKATQISIQNLNEYILVVADYEVKIYTNVDGHMNEWVNVDRETRNVNWFSGGSRTKIADAKILVGAIQVADAVVGAIVAGVDLNEDVIQKLVDLQSEE